jgi:hypothetical protein
MDEMDKIKMGVTLGWRDGLPPKPSTVGHSGCVDAGNEETDWGTMAKSGGQWREVDAFKEPRKEGNGRRKEYCLCGLSYAVRRVPKSGISLESRGNPHVLGEKVGEGNQILTASRVSGTSTTAFFFAAGFCLLGAPKKRRGRGTK